MTTIFLIIGAVQDQEAKEMVMATIGAIVIVILDEDDLVVDLKFDVFCKKKDQKNQFKF